VHRPGPRRLRLRTFTIQQVQLGRDKPAHLTNGLPRENPEIVQAITLDCWDGKNRAPRVRVVGAMVSIDLGRDAQIEIDELNFAVGRLRDVEQRLRSNLPYQKLVVS